MGPLRDNLTPQSKIKAQELVRNQFNESMSHLLPDNGYATIHRVSAHTNYLIQAVKELPLSPGYTALSGTASRPASTRDAHYT